MQFTAIYHLIEVYLSGLHKVIERGASQMHRSEQSASLPRVEALMSFARLVQAL